MELFFFFWQGHEGKFSVYVHASKEKPVHVSRYFVNRDIHSDQVCLIAYRTQNLLNAEGIIIDSSMILSHEALTRIEVRNTMQ